MSPTPASREPEGTLKNPPAADWIERQLSRDIIAFSLFLSIVVHALVAAPLVGVHMNLAQAHGFTEVPRGPLVAPTELKIVKRAELTPAQEPLVLPEPLPEPIPESLGAAEPPPAPVATPPPARHPAPRATRTQVARAVPSPPAPEEEGRLQRLGAQAADADAPAGDPTVAGAGALDDGPPAAPPAGAPTGVAGGTGDADAPPTPGVDLDKLLRAYLASIDRAVRREFAYPRAALRAGLEGQCVVVVTIDAEGRIVRAVLDGSSGHEILDRAALAAASSIKQVPPAPSELGWTERSVKIPFNFRLRG